MNNELIAEAEALGINASLYFLLPRKKRERLLQRDIDRARKLATEQSAADDE